MKKLLRSLRKNWIRVWLICAIGILSILAAYAAYTEVSSVKRVASTVSAMNVLFSSNSMDNPMRLKRMDSSATTSGDTVSWDVTVCNFDQNKPREPEERDITYTLNACLEVWANGEYIPVDSAYVSAHPELAQKLARYTIGMVADDANVEFTPESPTQLAGTTYSISGGLKGGVSSTDQFRVTIDKSDTQEENMTYVVHVTAMSNTGIELNGRLYGQQLVQDIATWNGKITDTNLGEHDFFNYLISGSGRGTVDLFWNPDKIEINQYFLDINAGIIKNSETNHGVITLPAGDADHPGWKKITLNVKSDECSRYELQLFKVPDPENSASYNVSSTFIDCKFNSVS